MNCSAANVIVCNICSKQFFSELNFSIHSRGHASDSSVGRLDPTNVSTDRDFTCLDDDYSSKQSDLCDKILNGLNLHPKEVPVINDENETRNNTSSVRKFSPTKENSKKKSKEYKCGVCFGLFQSASTFKKHYLVHMEEKAQIADSCPDQPPSGNPLLTNESKSLTKLNQTEGPTSNQSSHVCGICHDKFASNIELLIHARSHSKKDKLSCSYCGKKFFRKASLVVHQLTHFSKNSFQCETCKVDLPSKLLLAVHQQTHTVHKPLTCKICLQAFPHKIALKEHYGEHNLKKIRCEFCGKRFSTQDDLGKHLFIHLEDESGNPLKEFACDKCLKAFQSKDQLEVHQVIHVDSVDLLSCNQCERVFSSKRNLKLHQFHHQSSSYSCNLCDEKFVSENQLKDHLVLHANPDKFLCNICGEKLKNKYALYNHRLSHRAKLYYPCTECSKVCSSKVALKSHVFSHSGIKPFVCNYCNKRFSQLAHLNRHIRIHTGEKPYTCDVCNKSFTQKESLTIHARSHSGERPFMCEICGFRFPSKAGLKIHLGRHRSDEPVNSKRTVRGVNYEEQVTVLGPNQYNASCQVCDKHFFSKASYKLHMLKHTTGGSFKCVHCNRDFVNEKNLKEHVVRMHVKLEKSEKKFACSYCEKRFWTSTHLRRHQYMHTGEKWFECQLCHKRFTSKVNLNFHLKNKVCVRDSKNENISSDSNE